MRFSKKRLRVLGIVSALACTTGLVASLSACGEKKGGLMLAVNTDMKAPKDVNVITLSVLVNNQVKVNYQGRVTPDGKVLLPATVALAEPSDPNASVRIRVVAFQERKARVLRDVRTTIPTAGRIALLRIPLNFVNDGSGSGELPIGMVVDDKPISDTGMSSGASSGGTGSDGGGTSSGSASGGTSSGGDVGGSFGSGEYNPYEMLTSSCPLDQTMIDGECKDDYVDSSTLPDYDEKLVGRGDDPGICFDAAKCFANAVPIPMGQADSGEGRTDPMPGGEDGAGEAPDAGVRQQDFSPRSITLDLGACAVDLNGADPNKLNLALVTPDTGECLRPSECYVPIDKGAGGWREENGRVQLPRFVCRLLNDKHLRLFASEGTCSAKTESNPICAERQVPMESDGRKNQSPSDAGTLGPQLVIPEPYATTVRLFGPDLYFAGEGRFGRLGLFGGQPATAIPLPTTAPSGRQPWVINVSADGALVLTSATSPNAYAMHGSDESPQTHIIGQAPVNGGASTFDGFAFGVGGTAGGIYHSYGSEPAMGFEPAGSVDVTALAGGGSGFVYGTGDGRARACSFGLSNCGPYISVGPTRVDDFAPDPRPEFYEFGYILLHDRIVRAQMFTEMGTMSIVGDRPSETTPVDHAGNAYRRQMATAPQVPGCLVFTSTRGVEWMKSDLSGGGILVPLPLAKPGLGITLGPGDPASGGEGMAYVYYAVYASMADGGGIWRAPLPSECGGPGTGSAGGDAGSGDFDPSPEPPRDAEAPTCMPQGATCDDFTAIYCCSGTCVESQCTAL